ncbi:prepilin peptidase (plasmid) [Candidatus Fukatsuia symbiotica]|uniref:prepilin peptidase n=1 Tax=Candidatus Fukatsuia symbiotica TaxID=1878942 RepID=UPI000E7684D7|nr:prepilin peptidase [Candidatus Fukatsuia symbiotica]MEA9445896.1 prepilin peptidase [Candidatus Fukatsuia symbiotica]
MTSVGLFCILLPIFLLMGHYLIAEAHQFIGRIEGTPPALLPFASLLIMLFAVVASLVSTRGLLLAQPWPLIFRDLMLLGWSVLLTQLDVARGWLPLRFTGGFILGGLLFTLLPYASSSALQALVEGGVIFGVLSLFRCWANRHGLERFGLGDVYLLMGLSVWLTLPVTVSLTLFALGIILLQAGLAWLGLAPQPREIPFAPYLCGSLTVAMLTQQLPL